MEGQDKHRTPRWLLGHLSSCLKHHLAYFCTVRKHGIILYRQGRELQSLSHAVYMRGAGPTQGTGNLRAMCKDTATHSRGPAPLAATHSRGPAPLTATRSRGPAPLTATHSRGPAHLAATRSHSRGPAPLAATRSHSRGPAPLAATRSHSRGPAPLTATRSRGPAPLAATRSHSRGPAPHTTTRSRGPAPLAATRSRGPAHSHCHSLSWLAPHSHGLVPLVATPLQCRPMVDLSSFLSHHRCLVIQISTLTNFYHSPQESGQFSKQLLYYNVSCFLVTPCKAGLYLYQQ